MLARLALLLILVPIAALAADDAPPSAAITVPAASAKAKPDSAQAARGATPILSPLPPAGADSPTDPAQCRMSCASANYACHAGDDPDSCDGAWSQCVATCDAPNLDPGVSTAP